MTRLFWDLETSPLDDEQLLNKLMPDFTAASNVKDPAKIAAQIEEKKKDWLDKLALKAITGRIVAVTIAQDDGEPVMHVGDEKNLIIALVDNLKEVISQNASAYAWNGSGFDLLFLCQRAAVHNIPAFRDLTVNVRGKFYWHESLIDPLLAWTMYQDKAGASLNSVGIALGVGEKAGSGKDIAALLKSNPDEAKAYALNDVTLLRAIVQRIGI